MKVGWGYSLPNFLELIISPVQKTETATQEMATTADNKKFIYTGTVLPSSDPKATGIVFETVDTTDDTNRPASIIRIRRIYGNRLKTLLSSEAKTVLEKEGFVILDTPEYEF